MESHSGEGPERGRIRVDMHLHTSCSFDSLSDPEAVLEVAAERGIDRVCITDHNEIDAAVQLKERHPSRVIVGEEVKTAEGVDIIGLFLQERIPGGTPALKTCERIREQGALVYVPHPFAGGKGGGGRLLDTIAPWVDVVEGFNARIHRQELNEKAAAWGRARNLPLGAGSDAHTLDEVGRAFVEMTAFEDARSFLAALATARIIGRASSRAVHAFSTFAKLRKLMRAG